MKTSGFIVWHPIIVFSFQYKKFRHQQHELLEYWNYLGAKGQEIENLYIKYAINRKIADIYIKDVESFANPNPVEKVSTPM